MRKNVLVLTRWHPDAFNPVKCVFVKNILTAQAEHTDCNYTLLSPTPYFPTSLSRIFNKYPQSPYVRNMQGYKIFCPCYFKLPHPLLQSLECRRYLDATLRCIKKETLRFDIIHSHGFYPDAYVAVKVGALLNIPVVVHAHDSYFPALRKKHISAIDEIMIKAGRIIAVSNFQKYTIESVYPQHQAKISVVNNGVDLTQFRYRKKETSGDLLRLVFVGPLIEGKRVINLLNAFATISGRFPTSSLDIYGDGERRAECESTIIKLRLEKRVKICGIIENSCLPEIFPRYDLLIFPSMYETFGIVPLEALACGVPVVASRVGAVPEMVSSQDYGVLVEPDNTQELAAAIEKALHLKWDRKKISEASTRFSLTSTVVAIEAIYNELLTKQTK